MKLKSKIILLAALIGCMFTSVLDVNAEHTPLHDAVAEGNIEKTATLCEEHPEWLSEEDDVYGVPLMYAETPEMIDCLVKRGAKLESMKLSWVIVTGRVELAKYMIKNGADVNNGLFVATSVGNEDLIKYMVENGANVSGALPAAAATGNIDLIKYFMDKGADINLKDKNGYTLLSSLLSWCKNYESERLSSAKSDSEKESTDVVTDSTSEKFGEQFYENMKKTIDYLRSVGAEE